jgi:hypothetical protein
VEAQYVMAGSVWWSKATHLVAFWGQRKARGTGVPIPTSWHQPFKGTVPVTSLPPKGPTTSHLPASMVGSALSCRWHEEMHVHRCACACVYVFVCLCARACDGHTCLHVHICALCTRQGRVCVWMCVHVCLDVLCVGVCSNGLCM